MNSNKKEASPLPESNSADAKAEKHSRIIERISRYMNYAVSVTLWAMVALWAYIAIVDTAVKTELISSTSLAVKYRELVALVVLMTVVLVWMLLWMLSAGVLRKILSKAPRFKPLESPLSGSPQSNNIESPREQTIQHLISSITRILVAGLCFIAVKSLAGKSTTIAVQLPPLPSWFTTNITIQFPDLSTNSTDLTGSTALVVAVLISIMVGTFNRQFFLKVLSRIWNFVKNLFRF